MSLEYGKEIAEQTLNHLSSPEDPLFRISKAWLEIDLIGTGDVNPEIYHQVKSWKERYLKANLPDSKNWKEDELKQIFQGLSEDLVSICCEIIENNSILISSKV
jgi:ethanolamine ammonia-lyase large subunit